MALTCSQKSSQSPFSHIDVYGVEHPTFGALKCASRTSSVKRKSAKTTSHKAQSNGMSRKTNCSSRKSVRSTTLMTSKKKKKSTRDSAKSNETRTINHSPLHSMKPPSVACPTTSLAKVDRDSPVQRVSINSQRNSWTRSSRARSETSSGYGKSGSSSRTAISNPSVVTHSSMSTTDVLLSMNKSQDNLKSKILTSPIHVSLKRGTAQSASCSRTFNSGPSRRPPSQRCGGSRGDSLTVEDVVWGLSRLQYRNVIVMSGAGISTSSGIPDFR